MSTKVYNGLRLNVDGLHDLHGKMTDWRHKVADLQRLHDAEVTARLAVSKIDDEAMKGEIVYGAIHTVGWQLQDRRLEVKRTDRRDPLVDTEFTLCVMPYEDTLLAIAYCEHRKWISQFTDLPWVEEYAYWNNTDPPDEMSETEWEERGKAWENVTKSDPLDRPGNCGFTYECLPCHVFVKPEECMPFIPTWDHRVTRVAENQSRTEWATLKGMTHEKLIENILANMRKHADWLKTEEGIQHMAVLRPQVEAKLKRDLTEDDLQRHRPADA